MNEMERRARASHPAGRGRVGVHQTLRRLPDAPDPRRAADPHDGEDGSLVMEYGLLAVVAATVAGVVVQWASGGALVTLFNALLRQARDLVGA